MVASVMLRFLKRKLNNVYAHYRLSHYCYDLYQFSFSKGRKMRLKIKKTNEVVLFNRYDEHTNMANVFHSTKCVGVWHFPEELCHRNGKELPKNFFLDHFKALENGELAEENLEENSDD